MTPEEGAQLQAENAELRKALESALERIKDLEAQLAQNSRNSGWPSSRDKGKKRRKGKNNSLRKATDKKPGGQAGHTGQTLEFSTKPDRVEHHRPEHCGHCQQRMMETGQVDAVQSRQVVDIPPLQMEVVEHQVETLVCSCCGHKTSGEFPVGVTNPVQYGPRIKALAVYLKVDHFVPYARLQRILSDVFKATISPGTIQNFVHRAARQLTPVLEKIEHALKAGSILHVDESGYYIGGKRLWLHVASTAQLTCYASHPKRGKDAIDEIGILPAFKGTAVHDGWASYWRYDHCDHALCNVHHLRELNGIEERFSQIWAPRLKQFLLATKAIVKAAKLKGEPRLSAAKLHQVERIYQRLISVALAANPPPPEGWPKAARGRPRKTKARNLAERLDMRSRAVLAFVFDFNLPFDNNLAERDIRMLKVQQKISGCFRSSDGANAFCTTRSYISSLRKQNLDVWSALNSIFNSHTLIEPNYTPV